MYYRYINQSVNRISQKPFDKSALFFVGPGPLDPRSCVIEMVQFQKKCPWNKQIKFKIGGQKFWLSDKGLRIFQHGDYLHYM